MTTNAYQRCAHPACTCSVFSGEDAYCSDHCRKRVESPTTSDPEGCQCGHAECEAARDEAEKMRQQASAAVPHRESR